MLGTQNWPIVNVRRPDQGFLHGQQICSVENHGIECRADNRRNKSFHASADMFSGKPWRRVQGRYLTKFFSNVRHLYIGLPAGVHDNETTPEDSLSHTERSRAVSWLPPSLVSWQILHCFFKLKSRLLQTTSINSCLGITRPSTLPLKVTCSTIYWQVLCGPSIIGLQVST